MTSSPKSDVRPRKAETTHRYDTPQPIDSRRLERGQQRIACEAETTGDSQTEANVRVLYG